MSDFRLRCSQHLSIGLISNEKKYKILSKNMMKRFFITNIFSMAKIYFFLINCKNHTFIAERLPVFKHNGKRIGYFCNSGLSWMLPITSTSPL